MARKALTLVIYACAIVLLGGIAGAFCWLFFFLMGAGIDLVWVQLPDLLVDGAFWWPLPVCLVGGLAVGLFQKRWPGRPAEMNEVMAQVGKTSRYEYKTVFVDFFGALIPLLFGASIGPEAGLTGVIAGACTWVGDRLKFLGREFRDLAEVGIVAVVGAMFDAPLYGLAVPVFGDGEARESMADAKVLVPRPAKIIAYVVAVAAALAAMVGLGMLFGGMGGLPRFTEFEVGTYELLMLVPLALAGTLVGWLSHAAEALSTYLERRIGDHPIAKALLAGLVLGAFGCVLPYTMFAGETQAEELQQVWMGMAAFALVATALVKPFILHLCLSMGWRGGKFFPMIFAGIAMGYGMALVCGADPGFCVCACTAAALGAMMRQPLMVVLLLILCFPMKCVVVMLVCAAAGSLVPNPFAPKAAASADDEKAEG